MVLELLAFRGSSDGISRQNLILHRKGIVLITMQIGSILYFKLPQLIPHTPSLTSQ